MIADNAYFEARRVGDTAARVQEQRDPRANAGKVCLLVTTRVQYLTGRNRKSVKGYIDGRCIFTGGNDACIALSIKVVTELTPLSATLLGNITKPVSLVG